MRTGFWSVGTALPRYRIEQEGVLDFMRGCYGDEPVLLRRLGYIYRRSQIEARYTCCPEFAQVDSCGAGSMRFGQRSTAERMALYEEVAWGLACDAADRALAQVPLAAADITHLIFVTCTGFAAPGPEWALIERLGLRRDIRRLQVGFMGCQAALHGLQAADAVCRADPGAVVLLVCTELCTLHFNSAPTEENLVVNSLFGDGAAAMVLAGREAPYRLVGFASRLVLEERHAISWRIGDSGFHMGLDLAVPAALRRALPAFVDHLLCAVERREVGAWAVHPGGRAILDVIERCLGLDAAALEASRAILRDYGNMSSPSVLFVLARLLADDRRAMGAMLSFGPGLSLEGLVWERGSA